MSVPVGFIFTVTGLVSQLVELAKEYIPELETIAIVDDRILDELHDAGHITELIRARVNGYVECTAKTGAKAVLITCSSIGACAKEASGLVKIPVVRIDQAMVDKAIAAGTDIGVLATLSTTLKPTLDLIKERAALAGKEVRVHSSKCEGAFEALKIGNFKMHDEIVMKDLSQMASRSEVVLLAQASMARVAERARDAGIKATIFTSPRLGIESLSRILLGKQNS